jgi:hypothetical protein
MIVPRFVSELPFRIVIAVWLTIDVPAVTLTVVPEEIIFSATRLVMGRKTRVAKAISITEKQLCQ